MKKLLLIVSLILLSGCSQKQVTVICLENYSEWNMAIANFKNQAVIFAKDCKDMADGVIDERESILDQWKSLGEEWSEYEEYSSHDLDYKVKNYKPIPKDRIIEDENESESEIDDRKFSDSEPDESEFELSIEGWHIDDGGSSSRYNYKTFENWFDFSCTYPEKNDCILRLPELAKKNFPEGKTEVDIQFNL